MKKITGKLLAAILAVMMVASVCTVAHASSIGTNITDYGLRFDTDGKFRVLQITDIEAGGALGNKTKELIAYSVKRYSPNLVLLTGDNTLGTKGTSNFVKFGNSLKGALGGTPFAVTFGETDNIYSSDVARLAQYNACAIEGKVDFDNNFSNIDLGGVGTGCIPIQNQDGSGVAWNLVMIDSGVIASSGGYGKPGYSDVAPYDNESAYNDVVKWFTNMNTAMAEYTADGKLAPTLCFQHIPLQEFYDCGIIKECSKSDSGAVKAGDNTGHTDREFYYNANTANDTVTGSYTTACHCSATSTLDLYKAYAAEGNVKGVFYGHDHTNTIVGEGTINADGRNYRLVQGYTPEAKDSNDDPALRLFELYEDGSYDTEIVKYKTVKTQMTGGDNHFYMDSKDGTVKYISELATSYASSNAGAQNGLLRNGFTVYDYDLNKGSSSQDYIFMGYKTTNDPDQAITGIRFQVGGKGTTCPDTINSKVNGIECEFTRVHEAGSTSTGDLNKGIGGSYIYMYVTRDKNFPPITNLLINSTEKQVGWTDATKFSDINKTAELNEGNSKAAYIYVHYKTEGVNVQYEHDKLAKLIEDMNKIAQNGADVYTNDSISALREKVAEAQVIIDSYKESSYNYTYSKSDIYAALKGVREARNNLMVYVYFDANGGSINVDHVEVPIGVQKSYSLKLGDFVPTGSSSLGEFMGWSTAKSSETGYKDVIEILGNTTLYAVWSGKDALSDSENTDDEVNTDSEISTNTDSSTDTGSDTNPENALYGDVNCDGKVTMEDVTTLQKILAQLTTHESYGTMSKTNSDCNDDGQVNMIDVTQIQKFLASLISTLGPVSSGPAMG